MRIYVNGDAREVPAGETVTSLVRRLDLSPVHVAVEVNEELVRRAAHDSHALRDGDRIEIVTLVGGG